MIDHEIAGTAAEQANKLFGQWMPQRWLNLFIDAYDDIAACRAAQPLMGVERTDRIDVNSPEAAQWSETMRLKSENENLLAALKDVFALIDEGWLVRNTSEDHKPSFAMRQLSFVRRLATAQAAIPSTAPVIAEKQTP